MKQLTLAATRGFEKHSRATCKAEFLTRMEGLMPWSEFCAVIERWGLRFTPKTPLSASISRCASARSFHPVVENGRSSACGSSSGRAFPGCPSGIDGHRPHVQGRARHGIGLPRTVFPGKL